MAGRLLRRLPKDVITQRNKKIVEYAVLHPELSYRQIGLIFKLSTMTIYNMIGPRPKREQHYCAHCGSSIPAPLPEPGDLPISIEGDLSVAEVSE